MLLKNYKYKRPSDLTMPITFELNSILIKEELCRIKDQIKIRNFSGANKMMFNLIKFQKFPIFLNLNYYF